MVTESAPVDLTEPTSTVVFLSGRHLVRYKPKSSLDWVGRQKHAHCLREMSSAAALQGQSTALMIRRSLVPARS